jgi:cysteine desulfuration protein SufE
MAVYPPALLEIVELFELFTEGEKRENLVAFADSAPAHEPREGEVYDLVDVRKDEECADTVGIHIKRREDGGLIFRVKLGPHVQTLTRAMTAILCKGLEGSKPETVLEMPQDFVLRIVGGQLVRVRSQTVFYVLTRLKSACRVLLNRERAATVND